MTSSNITEIHPGQKLHIFITSLYSQNFFYHYEFFEKHPSNMHLEDKDKIAVRWWYPDILFDYHEPVTRFELFRRQMRIGYSKFGESLTSAVVIVPSNFNDVERNFDVDAIYGDKIVILTKNLAKLYYILSKIIKTGKKEFIGDRNVIIIFVQEKSIIGELYKVGNREFYLLERTEIIIPSSVNANKDESKNEEQKPTKKIADPEITLYSIIADVRELLNKNKEKFAFTVVFRANMKEKTLDSTKLEDYFFVDETKAENEILKDGALFKAQTDFEGNSYTFVDNTRSKFLNFIYFEQIKIRQKSTFTFSSKKPSIFLEMPHFNIVYPLLNAASKYHPTTEAFGIDLGTSRSALSVQWFQKDEDILIVVPDESDEECLLYSWIAFDQTDQKTICGKTVYDRFNTKGDYIVYDCKKIIGKSYEDIEISKYWKFKLIDNKKGSVNIKVLSKDEAGKDVYKIVTPEEVYAIMLQRFQSNALKFLSKRIQKAVFAVPSNFGQKEKAAMREAAKLANIEVLRFIPEPTAAALSYCSEMERQLNNDDKIFVFDLGGGTFDISIFKVDNLKLIELCQHSNSKLGGTNFNEMLFNYSKNAFMEELHFNLEGKENDLLIKSSNAKEYLTLDSDTNITFQKENNEDIDLVIERDTFEEIVDDLLTEIKEDIDKALNKAHLEADNITLVIKVGGSCAMPMIKTLISEKFPKSEVKFSDPQHEVAKGAALYASSILPQRKEQTGFIKNFWPL